MDDLEKEPARTEDETDGGFRMSHLSPQIEDRPKGQVSPGSEMLTLKQFLKEAEREAIKSPVSNVSKTTHSSNVSKTIHSSNVSKTTHSRNVSRARCSSKCWRTRTRRTGGIYIRRAQGGWSEAFKCCPCHQAVTPTVSDRHSYGIDNCRQVVFIIFLGT